MPTARTKNITPLMPAQYSGLGLREISVYTNSGGPASSAYSERRTPINAVRNMNTQDPLERHCRGPGKSSSVADRSDWLRYASQKSFSDMPRLFADARVLGYLVESLSRFAESKLQRNFPLLSAQRQMQ